MIRQIGKNLRWTQPEIEKGSKPAQPSSDREAKKDFAIERNVDDFVDTRNLVFQSLSTAFNQRPATDFIAMR